MSNVTAFESIHSHPIGRVLDVSRYRNSATDAMESHDMRRGGSNRLENRRARNRSQEICESIVATARAHGIAAAVSQFAEGVNEFLAGEPGLNPNDISLRDLFEWCVPNGREAVEYLNPAMEFDAFEFDAVNTALFSRITRVQVDAGVMDGYLRPVFTLSSRIPTRPTSYMYGERQIGVTGLSVNDVGQVGEGQAYPRGQFSDKYRETPATDKFGLIVGVTREAIFAGPSQQITNTAASVGEMLAMRKENALIDLLIGATNNYKRNGVSANTYLTSGSWVNDQSNPLVTWQDIEASKRLWLDMTDPESGERILIAGQDLLFDEYNEYAVGNVFNAVSIDVSDGASTVRRGPNPLNGLQRNITFSQFISDRIVSQLGQAQSNARQWWFHGDVGRAFEYMENWPITTVTAPRDSKDAFERDIVIQWKASERGVGAVKDPRYMIRNKH
jgi:hypothetical protein